MKLEHRFTVPLPIDDAWQTLTDLEFIAPCLPGARLTGRDGDDFLGAVRIKVGPITTEFSGAARFADQDRNNYVATINAEGRDTKTSGAANAVVHARLSSEGAATVVAVETELAISGKLAQFGRAAISDISAKLMDQFAENLDRRLTTLAQPGTTATGSAHIERDQPADDVLDVAGLVGVPVRVRVVSAVTLVVATCWLIRLIRVRRSPHRS